MYRSRKEGENMNVATSTQMKNSFGRYLNIAMSQGEVLIERHGKIVAKLISYQKRRTYLADSLKGLAAKDEDPAE